MTNSIREKFVLEWWQEIQKVLNEYPVHFNEDNAICHYEISGSDAGTYQLHQSDGHAAVVEGSPKEAVCTLKLSYKGFKETIIGKLKGTTALMMGNLKIEGNIGQLLKWKAFCNSMISNEYGYLLRFQGFSLSL